MCVERTLLNVNGTAQAVHVEPRRTLLDALRNDLGLTGTKKACDMGIPWRAHAAERVLLGSDLDQGLFEKAADAALHGAEPLRLNGWKVPLAKALVKRSL